MHHKKWACTFLLLLISLWCQILALLSEIRCIQKCLNPSGDKYNTPTSIPQIVPQSIFTGENCAIYGEDVVPNCSFLNVTKDVIKIDKYLYFLAPNEMSWFAAQKFCHSGGWTMGAVTGAAMEREMVRQWQAKIGSSSLWSAANSLASKGSTFSNAETGLIFIDPELPKDSQGINCLLYSSFDGSIKKKAEKCSKTARFFCQLKPLCPMTYEMCASTISNQDDASKCKDINYEPKESLLVSGSCQAPKCPISLACEDRVVRQEHFIKPKVAVPIGQLRSLCGRHFYFGRDFFPLSTALDFCCSLGMKMVSVENAAKLSCLTEAISKLDCKEMGSRWWTSATDSGCPGKLAWCGSGEMYSEAALGVPEGWKEMKGASTCVVLKGRRNSSSLKAASCEEFSRPLCEGIFPPRRVYSSRKCPRLRCRLNVDVLGPKNDLFFSNFCSSKVKNSTYVFLQFPRRQGDPKGSLLHQKIQITLSETWTDAQAICCSMGMWLISVSEPEVVNIMQRLMLEKVIEDNNYYKKKDKLESLSFWTAGYEWDNGRFVWCPSGETFPTNTHTWTGIKVETSGKQQGGNCLLAVLGEKRKSVVSENCSAKNNFMCDTFETDVSPDCEIGVCNYNAPPDEYPLASRSTIQSYELIKGKVLIDTCKRHLVVSRDSAYNFHEQTRFCMSLKMTLLYIDTPEDWTCIMNAISKIDFGKVPVWAHLPLTDTACPGKYVWCGTGKPLKRELLTAWEENRFDHNQNKSKTCLNLEFWENGVRLPKARATRGSCEKFTWKRKVICQVPAN